MTSPIICIVGKDKNAKTSLMEDLIKELKRRRLKVGALKYHKHGDFEIDIEGKDTWKYEKAGADTVAISSSVKFAVIKKVGSELTIDDICDKYFSDEDIVLADGFTMSDKPRIIVAGNKETIEIFKRGCCVLDVVGIEGSGFQEIAKITDKIIKYLDDIKKN